MNHVNININYKVVPPTKSPEANKILKETAGNRLPRPRANPEPLKYKTSSFHAELKETSGRRVPRPTAGPKPLDPPVPLAHPQLMESRPRRKLQAELNFIGDLLHNSPLDDHLTRALRKWHEPFATAIRQGVSPEILEEFKSLLSELLQDPVFYRPLEEDALLGSDGRTYNRRTLEIRAMHGSNVSPYDLSDQRPFSAKPHPLLPKLFWSLQLFLPQAYKIPVSTPPAAPAVPDEEPSPSESGEAGESSIPSEPSAPKEPSKKEDPEARARRFEERARRFTKAAEEAELKSAEEINRCAEEEVKKMREELLRKVREEFAVPMGERFETFQGNIEDLFNKEDARAQRFYQAAKDRAEQLKKDIADLRAKNEELQRELDKGTDHVSGIRRSEAEARMHVNECKIEIKEKESNKLGALFTIIGVAILIGIAIATGPGGAAAASSTAGGAGVAPTSGGGLNFFAFLRF